MENYESNLMLTYKIISDDGKYQQLLYQIQLLQLFKLDNYESQVEFDIINKYIDNLYSEIKNENFIKELIDLSEYKNIMEDDVIFRTFFSFQLLDLFHRCLHEFFNKKIVSDNSFTDMKNELLNQK
jgi:hypothetical protein